MGEIIDGKALAEEVHKLVKQKLQELNRKVTLSIIKVGDDPASAVYIRNKSSVAKNLGIEVKSFELNKDAAFDDIVKLIDKLNNDKAVNGILLQLPLPKHLPARNLIDRIAPGKDVDGLTLINQGKMFIESNDDILYPCTPMGVLHMIKSVCNNLTGLHAVVLGRSQIVGKPLSQMLLKANCTVSMAHSYSQDLPSICKNADIIVSAVGKPLLVQASWVKKGAIVIDVGINRDAENKIVGDADFASVSRIVKAISPVPGGVGPMTIAYLMYNTVNAAARQK